MNSLITQIVERLGITSLNEMQEVSLKAFQSNDDIVLLSPTGSGKTLAYLLPLICQINTENSDLQIIILVPSRELAIQIDSVIKSTKTAVRSMCCYGGRPAMEEHRSLRSVCPHILVATPGRMNDHLSKENVNAFKVRQLVIDEFDKCLEFGFQDEMNQVISKLPGLYRRILISATDAPEIPSFVREGSSSKQAIKRLDFLKTNNVPGQITQYLVHSPENDKLETLYRMLCFIKGKPAIVFVNYRDSVERVGTFLKEKGFYCECFHGGMEQEMRERALNKFRNGSSNVLVSTDLSARGLDIPEIEAIIHYHLPINDEAYIHRTGRTGRWDATGNSYLILNPKEEIPSYAEKGFENLILPETVDAPIAPKWVTLYIGKGKKDKLNKIDIVGFLCKKGGLTSKDLGIIEIRDHYAYAAINRNKIKLLMNNIRGEKIKGIRTLFELMKK